MARKHKNIRSKASPADIKNAEDFIHENGGKISRTIPGQIGCRYKKPGTVVYHEKTDTLLPIFDTDEDQEHRVELADKFHNYLRNLDT